MGNDDMKKRAAHYRGLAAGAKRMKDMGHNTASGGGGKPPKGCRKILILIFIAISGAVALSSWFVGSLFV